MSKIVILGWFGDGNFGDEIILECMLADIRRLDPSVSFVVISDDPADTTRRHGVRSIGRGGSIQQRLRRLRELISADLFILGGGAILSRYSNSDRSVLAWLVPMHLAHDLGLPTMTCAVGVGDDLSANVVRAMRRVLGETDAICVRDLQSVATLRQIGISDKVTLTADPAVLIPTPDSARIGTQASGTRPKVTVFLRHWYVSEDRVQNEAQWAEFKTRLASCLDSLILTRTAQVRFVPMRIKDPIDDDRVVAREVSSIMTKGSEATIVDRELSSSELLRMVAESDLVIGMRLHSLIAAASLGVPMIAINYHMKVRSFMESIGLGEWITEVGDSDPEWLREAAKAALAGGYPSAAVQAKVEGLKVLAHLNTEIAIKLVHDSSYQRGAFRRTIRASRILISRSLGWSNDQ